MVYKPRSRNDQADYVVEISIIIDATDPRRVRWTGVREQGQTTDEGAEQERQSGRPGVAPAHTHPLRLTPDQVKYFQRSSLNSFTMARPPLFFARSKAVSPSLSLMVVRACCRSKTRIELAKPLSAANIKAVFPSWSARFTSAPLSIRTCAISDLSSESTAPVAHISGVWPALFREFASAPRSINGFTSHTRFCPAAYWSTVSPPFVGSFTSAPCVSRSSVISRFSR